MKTFTVLLHSNEDYMLEVDLLQLMLALEILLDSCSKVNNFIHYFKIIVHVS